MENFTQRFNHSQEGGKMYNFTMDKTKRSQEGGEKKKLSPSSENWKKKYLEMKIQRDNFKKENQILKKKLQSKS